MNKLKGKELEVFYARYFLDCFNFEGQDVPENLTPKQQFKEAYKIMDKEMIQNHPLTTSTHQHVINWLQGLASACSIDYYWSEVIKLAEQTGHLTENSTETQIDNIKCNYWSFMANMFLKLANRSNKWFKTNIEGVK